MIALAPPRVPRVGSSRVFVCVCVCVCEASLHTALVHEWKIALPRGRPTTDRASSDDNRFAYADRALAPLCVCFPVLLAQPASQPPSQPAFGQFAFV
uniref:Putative secreted protein n=1 Tax=Anopheles marajoara TaxID=58244 RepID=A0A2M4C9C2_9DIPT